MEKKLEKKLEIILNIEINGENENLFSFIGNGMLIGVS